MDRAYQSGAAGSAPTAPGSPSLGYPTGGNPGSGTPATKPGPYFYHMIVEELMAIIAAAGITPAQGTLTQLLTALRSAGVFQTAADNDRTTKAATTAFANPAAIIAADGYVKLPSGIIFQWGITTSCNSGSNLVVTLPVTYPNTNWLTLTAFTQASDASVGSVFVGQVRSLATNAFTLRNLGPSAAQYHYLSIGY